MGGPVRASIPDGQTINVLMSPVFGAVTPLELAEWILNTGLRLRFQQQLHKLIWGNEPGH